MKRLVIVGATGMVGGHALRYALEQGDVEHVTSIGRRKLGISHFKLTQSPHPDFAHCSTLAETLAGQDGAIYCLGTYTGVVPDAELRRVHPSSPSQQPQCGILNFKREWRGPDRAESDGFRSLQGRGRESAARGRGSPRLHFPSRLHLPR
jgi:hypothetical protein